MLQKVGWLWACFPRSFLEYGENVGESSLGVVIESGNRAAFVTAHGPFHLKSQLEVFPKVRTNP